MTHHEVDCGGTTVTQYEVGPRGQISCIKELRPTPVIGDTVTIKGRGTFLCCGKSDNHGYCTTTKCCLFNEGCTVIRMIHCRGVHWFIPLEDVL
jgi:hypothetical protein